MAYDGNCLGVYRFLTSSSFCRVQERAIRSSGERVMAVKRHEEIKQHRRPRPCVNPTPLRARGSVLLVLSHAPAWDFHAPMWATNMSPNLVYFKAHPRGFGGGL